MINILLSRRAWILSALVFLNIGVKEFYRVFDAYEIVFSGTLILTLFSILVAFVTLKSLDRRYSNIFGFALLLYLLLCISSLFGDPAYGVQKAYLGLIVPFSMASVFSIIKWKVEDVLDGLFLASAMICLIAIGYKTQAGFFDRTTSFGLLGPITFGWIAGIGLFSALLSDRKVVIRGLSALFFFSMIIWSGSKGPLLASVLVGGYYFKNIVGYSLTSRVVTFFLIATVIGVLYLNYSEIRSLNSIVQFISDPKSYSEGLGQGSFGSRIKFFGMTMQAMSQTPMLGMGWGGWVNEFTDAHRYPHNMILELLAETGVIGLVLLLTMVVKLLNIGPFNKIYIIAIFGFTTLMFSGDFSYFRYPLFILLMAVLMGLKQGD